MTPSAPRRALSSLPAANRPLVVIIAAGFLVRLSWILYADPQPISDWHFYKELAFGLLDHGQLGYPEKTTFYLPGQPLYLAVWAVVSRSDRWLAVGMATLSTATIPLIHAVGTRVLRNRGAALAAAGMFAGLPLFVFFSPVLATEHLFVALVMITLLLLLRWNAGAGRRHLFAAGAVLGMAMLTRGEGVFYLPALLLFVFLGSPSRTWRQSLRAMLLLIAGVFLVVVPWQVRNASVEDVGSGLSTGAGINFYFAHNDTGIYGWYPEGQPFEGLSNREANRLGWQLAWEYLGENPLRIFENVPFGTLQLLANPEYALYWSTHYVAGDGDRNDPSLIVRREVFGIRLLEEALRFSAATTLVMGALSVLALTRWTREMWTLILPLIGSIWFLRTAIYWAKPRYRYTGDVLILFFAALVGWILARRPPEPVADE